MLAAASHEISATAVKPSMCGVWPLTSSDARTMAYTPQLVDSSVRYLTYANRGKTAAISFVGTKSDDGKSCRHTSADVFVSYSSLTANHSVMNKMEPARDSSTLPS
jgi:hypothetical protein